MSEEVNCQIKEEIAPLKTLESLLSWKVPKECVPEVINAKKLEPRACCYPPTACHPNTNTRNTASYPRTIVCHDMMGGYLDDRFYKGTKNSNAYRFYNWHGVDTFIYFSHAFITIPPPAWINAAHLHGVKVLGTLITEWDAGAEICKKMLSDEDTIERTVTQLVGIARHHRFEGWLINIENKIDPGQIDLLVGFMEKLTAAMRLAVEGSLVIWYDSVTSSGNLNWQNELNDKNRCFFDVSDGIFLNYTWNEEGLHRSREAAGDRKFEVYVGLDVFGRNFYKGGKFNTHKALEVARRQDLSVAIFAQGWTYETQRDNFVAAEQQLWQSLAPHLFQHGPRELPFRSNFCQGFGQKYFTCGEVTSSEPWHNLAQQQYQPIWTTEAGEGELSLVTSCAFTGGGCLELTTSEPRNFRVLECSIDVAEGLQVSLAYKWTSKVVPFYIILQHSTEDSMDGEVKLYCDACGENQKDSGVEAVVETTVNSWIKKTFVVEAGNLVSKLLKRVLLRLEGEASVLVGELEMTRP